jgi:hypothetical protein
MSDNEAKKNRKPKYLSVRRALQELKLNEEDLKKMVDKGTVNPVYENNELKFDGEEIEQLRLSRQVPISSDDADTQESPADPIEDEDLYKSSDANYESLFATRMGASINHPQKHKPKTEKPLEKTPSSAPIANEAIQPISMPEQASAPVEATSKRGTSPIPLPEMSAKEGANEPSGVPQTYQPQEIIMARGKTKVRQLERHLSLPEEMGAGCLFSGDYKEQILHLLHRLPFYFWGVITMFICLLLLNLLLSWHSAGSMETFVRLAHVKQDDLEPLLVVEGKMVLADLAQKEIGCKIRQTPLNFYIAKGTPVELLLSPQQKKFLGEVVAITPSISEYSDSVKIACSGEINNIPLGRSTTIKFILPKKNRCLQVPRESVIFPRHAVSQYQPLVFCAIAQNKHQYKLIAAPVRIGMSNLNFYEITEGLTGDEQVVVACNFGMDWLSEGLVVSERH